MDTEKTFGFGSLQSELDPRYPAGLDAPPAVQRSTSYARKSKAYGDQSPKKRGRPRKSESRRYDALSDGEEGRSLNEPVVPINPEDRALAQSILEQIGKRFARNREKGKSNAYERYQADLAENLNFLVAGGVMNLKEVSQTIMQLEEFRKQGSEHGKTAATILSEWLNGELPDEALSLR